MTWASAPPTEPGWYWCRDRRGPHPSPRHQAYRFNRGRVCVVKVIARDGVLVYERPNSFSTKDAGSPNLEWAGPLTPPT